MPAKVFLIPNAINDEAPWDFTSQAKLLSHISVFFIEGEKSARRLLKVINPQKPFDDYELIALNEHSHPQELKAAFQKYSHEDIGIISEAGCPCVADPGAQIVLWAHEEGREVVPLIGPSSILLALMASGLNGQNFAFHGYLPKDKAQRIKRIKDLETRSATEHQTQIFMEAPYRNDALLNDIVSVCHTQTLLCVACDLTGPTQEVKTLAIRNWKNWKKSFQKRPALFLIQKYH
jgi:16S rRNA (cytidine1402-2'-O)-methyltransferase